MKPFQRELRRHLARLAICSGASLGFGVEALLNMRGEWNHGFGTLTTGWAVVNLVIVAISRFGKPPEDLRKFREFLMLNMGLNLGYIGVGVAMAVWGTPWVWGAGVAVALQGAILLVLDGWLLRRVPFIESGPSA